MRTFLASEFVPTQWESHHEKARFANHFVRFIRGGFKWTVFPNWFYKRLSMTFGHIAHYGKGGFYATWFETPERRGDFIAHTLRYVPCGDPAWTYSDVERSIKLELAKHLSEVQFNYSPFVR